MDRIIELQQVVLGYYKLHGRDMPWRQPDADGTFDPYKIMVSELMLQQTQVTRVVPKYHEFVSHFPDIGALADVGLGEVLTVWQGLGYNRRAKYLHIAAREIVEKFNGKIPKRLGELITLPGIGANTAGAILVYAYNQPQIFIETNIRTVFIHHFFNDQDKIDDKEIYPLVEKSVQYFAGWEEKPENRMYFASDALNISNTVPHYRQWFWALMDYGSYLKSTVGNKSRQSSKYAKQSAFSGSLRQIRGQVIKQLILSSQDLHDLKGSINDSRLQSVLDDLLVEGFIKKDGKTYRLS
jgi:A/G-specific adenine glycosylase